MYCTTYAAASAVMETAAATVFICYICDVAFTVLKLLQHYLLWQLQIPCAAAIFMATVKEHLYVEQQQQKTDAAAAANPCQNYIGRMETEAKAKVVASIWGENVFNSLPRQLFITGMI